MVAGTSPISTGGPAARETCAAIIANHIYIGIERLQKKRARAALAYRGMCVAQILGNRENCRDVGEPGEVREGFRGDKLITKEPNVCIEFLDFRQRGGQPGSGWCIVLGAVMYCRGSCFLGVGHPTPCTSAVLPGNAVWE